MFLDSRLAHWAQQTPQADALRCVGQTLDYATLDARVTHLAQMLDARGFGRGHRIGLHLDKSIDSIVAVLGILRAGAGYVPLDPGAPAARLETVTRACDLVCVLTDARKAVAFPMQDTPLALLTIDGETLPGATRAATPPLTGPREPGDTAYVLYTSGSTGTPKGIHHTHASGLAYARMAASLCGLVPSDRVSNHTPLHFDMSIFDIFSTLLAGACVVIIPEMYTKIPASLAKLVEEERLTVWYSVPFALTQLTERGGLAQRDFSSLRIVMYAAEKMLPWQLKAFAQHVPQATFINAYGPTETNHVTSKTMRFNDLDGETAIPIGTPTPNVTAVIWADGQVADRGELLVATDQAMTGYWNDPDRTAAAFKEVDAGDGLRRYHATGDLVERLPNGDLDLVGRLDHQVKLRGFRVELGDVEHVMARCPGVAEAVASLAPDASALWGFVRLHADQTLDDDGLRAHCAAHLPPYSVPSHFVIREALPRTSTGKIDRTKLLEMTHD